MTATPYRNYRFGIGVSAGPSRPPRRARPDRSLHLEFSAGSQWNSVTLALWVGVPPLVVLPAGLDLSYMRARARTRAGRRACPRCSRPPSSPCSSFRWGTLHSTVDTTTGGSRATIAETHINLSDNALWLDTSPYASTYSGAPEPDLPMNGQTPERFVAFHRYPNAQSGCKDSAFPYDNASPKPKQREGYSTRRPPPGGTGTRLPLHRQSYPDTTAPSPPCGAHRVGQTSSTPTTTMPTTSRLPPRWHVWPALPNTSSERSRVEGLVQFRTHNYGAAPIVRLEINGATLDIGDDAIAPIAAPPAACTASNHTTGVALLNLEQPLRARLADRRRTAGMAQRARAGSRIPASPQPLDGQLPPQQVPIYVLADEHAESRALRGSVSTGDSRRAIKATGLPANAAAYATCGSANATLRRTRTSTAGQTDHPHGPGRSVRPRARALHAAVSASTALRS